MTSNSVQTAAGILSLLEEQDNDLKAAALTRLNGPIVDEFWAETADSIRRIEELYEDESFPQRKLAALIASRVYYHLNAFDESLQFALGAGDLFDVNKKNDEYTDKIVSKCIDTYITQRRAGEKNIDNRLLDIVERMFDRCFADGEYKQALGIAIESHRLDKIKESITKSNKPDELLEYTFDAAMNVIDVREFRQEVLRTLVGVYQQSSNPNHLAITQCHTFLDDSSKVAETLIKLLSSGDDDHVYVAYQVGFDLHDRAPQSFLTNIRSELSKTSKKNADPSEQDAAHEDKLDKLLSILTGQVSIQLYVDFLFRHNHTDLQVLKNIKGSFERNSILHSATITANAYMHAGTTIDQFLRENLEWLGKATNWAKFSATASLGVIHKGQIKESLNILKPYLPSDAQPTNANARNAPGAGSVYSEGGALYALGIIHSNHGDNMTDYLVNIVKKDSANPVVLHGACFGLGLCAMATGDRSLYERLKEILYLDNAVSGEAAGVAMGLVMMGSGNTAALEEMDAYAHETQHEKIIRGLSMGLALTMYGREEEANPLIDKLVADKDPILRYGAMYMIGLAYCGTSNNFAIRKLLQIAVSDVSDDVRRAAVINLGFLLFKSPKQCPRLVSLLAESYNPHVRYGVAMAIGISCAGTALRVALDVLDPLTKDGVDFVRQGALIAISMVLMQANESQEPKVSEYRKHYETVWNARGEEVMCKVGAILAQGVMDAGGRNVTICLHKSGHNKMRNIIGLALFTQYWFWYPYLHFLSMAFEPTAIIGLNKNLQMPKYHFTSQAKPSLFAYPPPMKPAQEKKTVKIGPAAELSLTAKAKAREQKKKRQEGGSAMDVEPSTPTPVEEKKEVDKKKKKEKEPDSEEKENPARVTPSQIKYLKFDKNERYTPIKFKDGQVELGFFLLKDNQPGQPETIVDFKNTKEEDLPEPEAPESFTWP
ncbi:26S proteasome subunit Rpn2 [Acrasis kona]|uniref:26S proteasome subunit Rpn2 n=1 Tax=Acrasis kona TaxID=1008807 RepID=A0AAW2ZMT7_9EUKA